MKKRTYLSAKQRAAAVEEYRGGVGAPALSKKYNVSVGSIYAWAKKAPKQNGRRTPSASSQKRARRQKLAPIAAAVDAVLVELREPLILIVEKLVASGVKAQLDNIADAIVAARKKHIAAIT